MYVRRCRYSVLKQTSDRTCLIFRLIDHPPILRGPFNIVTKDSGRDSFVFVSVNVKTLTGVIIEGKEYEKV